MIIMNLLQTKEKPNSLSQTDGPIIIRMPLSKTAVIKTKNIIFKTIFTPYQSN